MEIGKLQPILKKVLGLRLLLECKSCSSSLYVPPIFNKRHFLEISDKYLETYVDNRSKVIICGDFN